MIYTTSCHSCPGIVFDIVHGQYRDLWLGHFSTWLSAKRLDHFDLDLRLVAKQIVMVMGVDGIGSQCGA